MKSLEARLSELESQRHDIDIRIQEVRDNLRRLSGTTAAPKSRAKRSDVKGHLFRLLDKVAGSGLNAASAVTMARDEGIALERGTVSSLLSRLKNERAVIYDGSVYKLSRFKGDAVESADGCARPSPVVNFPASKGMG